MTRVIATLQHSAYSSTFSKENDNLKRWTREVLEASFSAIQVSGALIFVNSTASLDRNN